jgi:Flp pilus assembly secretin CpaC
MVSSTFVVGTGLLSGARAFAQDRPSAAQLLDRGSRLYEQKNYAEAKKLLLDIDPAQLPEDQRSKLNELLKNTDMEIAKSSTSGGFDEAQAALDKDHYAEAAQGFQGVLDNPSAPQDVKDKAKIQLALVRQKQAEKVPQMRELLNQAESLYNEGKLDEAQNALATVQNTGADLGWRDNARPAALAQKISERKTAMARGGNAAGTLQVAAPGDNNANTGAMAAPANNGANGMSAAQAALDAQPVAPGTPAATLGGAGTAGAANGVSTAAGSTIDQEAMRIALEHDRYLALFNQSIKASNDAITANPPQYAAAVDRAQQALAYVNEAYNSRVLSDAEANNYRNIAQQQLSMATTRRQVYEREQAAINEKNAAKANATRLAQLDKVRHRRIDALMAQADHYYSVQQYQECADTLRLLVSIDPQNSNAKLFLTLVTDRIQFRDFKHMTDLRGNETVRQGILSEESLIPYADLMIYPDDWVELSRRRLGDLPDQESAANRAVRQRLDEELNEISADQQGFEKVVGYLQTSTGTNIIVNWKALEGAGIDRNAAVTVNLKKVPFRKALTEILNEVGGATAALAYTIDDGVISISTKDDLTSQKYQNIRVFDIRDMLVQPDTTTQPPTFNLQAVTQGSGGGSGGGGGGGSQGSIFQTTNTTTTLTNAGNQAVVQEIVDTIQTIVAPDSWREKGGTIGSIRELNGQLIVNQTADNQTAVYNLLQQLRETRAIQISVEARLLLVSNNFLDDFGFGWSLAIPAGALGGNVGDITVANNTDTTAVPPLTGVPGSLGGGAITAPSLTVSGSIIDNYQLSLFLRATQADQRSVTVTAPRITLFNGQRGFIAVTAQRNYISNFNQTVAAGGINGAAAVATTLTVSTLSTGISLIVQATASADRRYVVMQVTPQLATLDGIDTFSSAPTGNSGNVTASTLALIQLPRISFTTINTMVSVPDGGTLLIGGQKLVGESEIEVGVPVLSKIPGLNRLFTNRSLVKDERTLLILVRPKIIIQKEIENGLFGPGYERPTGLPAGTPAPGVGAPGTAGFGIGATAR